MEPYENDQSDITEAQFYALNKAWDLLKEHFDNVVIVYDTECKEGTDRTFECSFKGGHTMAMGLAERAKLKLQKGIVGNDRVARAQ